MRERKVAIEIKKVINKKKNGWTVGGKRSSIDSASEPLGDARISERLPGGS